MNKRKQTGKITFIIGIAFVLLGAVGGELFGFGLTFTKILVGIGIIIAGVGAAIKKVMAE